LFTNSYLEVSITVLCAQCTVRNQFVVSRGTLIWQVMFPQVLMIGLLI